VRWRRDRLGSGSWRCAGAGGVCGGSRGSGGRCRSERGTSARAVCDAAAIELTERITRRAARALPPQKLRPYAVPAAAAVHEARWRWRLWRAPVMTAAEHAARVGVKDIEEVIGCSLCGDTNMQPLFTPEGRNGRWRYHVVRCPSCGFLYRHPGIRPERLGELYAGQYDKFLTGRYARKRQRRYRMVMDAFGTLFADGNGRRLLDFGCGAGLFLELAHERGFDGYGVDLSESSIERARTRPGGENAHFGAPQDVPEIAAGGFDVITLWSVMAHLPRPIDDLRMLRGLLAPGGVLLILTVNANSLRLKAAGKDWNGFTPNHLKFFSPSTLELALKQAGFEATAMPPMYSFEVEKGTARLSERDERRLRRVIARGNRGNMLRAAAFTSADGPVRWRLDAQPAAANAAA
jgi:2-polyprenyl-3-methyl-5-hydroxy-6-metoxy-1,4-benzoquinol methylase